MNAITTKKLSGWGYPKEYFMQTALAKSIIISSSIIVPMLVVRLSNFDTALVNFINQHQTLATIVFILPTAFLTIKWIVNFFLG